MDGYTKELAKRGLSLGEFAKIVGYSKTYVADILSGRKQVPKETEDRVLAGFSHCQWCHRKWPHPAPTVTRK